MRRGATSPGGGVLLAVVGLSPAIVTETLYALSVRGQSRRPIKEVHLIGTGPSIRLASRVLIGQKGGLTRLYRDYGIVEEAPLLTQEFCHPIRDSRGRLLHDIRTSEDSQAAGDAIHQILRQLKARGSWPLYASVAGGRKSLGVLLALAFQLVAEYGDQLYHVLVSDPFDRIPDFLYPAPRKAIIKAPSGFRAPYVRADLAKVSLHQIPLLRAGRGTLRRDNPMPFPRAMARAQSRLDRATGTGFLVVDINARTIRHGREVVRMQPQELMLYLVYARSRARCATRHGVLDSCQRCYLSDQDLVGESETMLTTLASIRGGIRSAESRSGFVRWARQKEAGLQDWYQQTRSRINRKLKESLKGSELYELCSIGQSRSFGHYHDRRRGILMQPAKIKVVGNLVTSRKAAALR